MTQNVSAGTTLSISAGVPSTFDQSGYEALSFTAVGEVTDLAGFGPQWATSAHKPLALRGTQKKKTSRDGGSFTATMALDTDNAGQIICKAARDSATGIYAIRITTPNGDDYYCQVLVTQFQPTIGNQDAMQTASMTCEVTASSTDVDWVEVLAA